MRGETLTIGSVVSREGRHNDIHLVIATNEDADLIEVMCISSAPHSIFKLGDREWNIPARYEYLGRIEEIVK